MSYAAAELVDKAPVKLLPSSAPCSFVGASEMMDYMREENLFKDSLMRPHISPGSDFEEHVGVKDFQRQPSVESLVDLQGKYSFTRITTGEEWDDDDDEPVGKYLSQGSGQEAKPRSVTDVLMQMPMFNLLQGGATAKLEPPAADPSPVKGVPRASMAARRRHRRGRGSLIDLAMKQSQSKNKQQGPQAVQGAQPQQAGGVAPVGTGEVSRAGQESLAPGTKHCRSCGGWVQPAFKFCEFCGKPLD